MVGAGLLQAQAGAGPTGLGYYLKTGPEDKNWEKKQAKANQEEKMKRNEEEKGSLWANILPKLGAPHARWRLAAAYQPSSRQLVIHGTDSFTM